MLAYEELQGSRGREIRYRPPRYQARSLFPNTPPRLRVGAKAYQIHNVSLGGVAAIAKEARDDELSVVQLHRLRVCFAG